MAKASDEYVKELQQEVARQEADNKALIEEFKKVAGERWTPEQIKEKFEELLPQAFIALKQLMFDKDVSEGVRASLIKFVIQSGTTGVAEDNKDKIALSQLISDLTTTKS